MCAQWVYHDRYVTIRSQHAHYNDSYNPLELNNELIMVRYVNQQLYCSLYRVTIGAQCPSNI